MPLELSTGPIGIDEFVREYRTYFLPSVAGAYGAVRYGTVRCCEFDNDATYGTVLPVRSIQHTVREDTASSYNTVPFRTIPVLDRGMVRGLPIFRPSLKASKVIRDAYEYVPYHTVRYSLAGWLDRGFLASDSERAPYRTCC